MPNNPNLDILGPHEEVYLSDDKIDDLPYSNKVRGALKSELPNIYEALCWCESETITKDILDALKLKEISKENRKIEILEILMEKSISDEDFIQ